MRGARVLELGSGTGVCGLYAAALGAACVTLTDGGSDDLLELTRSNVAANHHLISRNTSIEVRGLLWGSTDELPTELDSLDFVLASDVVYDDRESPVRGGDRHDKRAAE